MKLVKEMNPWTFTMGSALFTKNFVKDGSFRDNLKYVVDFLKTLYLLSVDSRYPIF